MLSEAEELRLNVITSLQRSKVPIVSRMGHNETCFPEIAGWGEEEPRGTKRITHANA